MIRVLVIGSYSFGSKHATYIHIAPFVLAGSYELRVLFGGGSSSGIAIFSSSNCIHIP